MLFENPLERYWTRDRCEYAGTSMVASVLVWFYFSHFIVFAGSLFFWLLKRKDLYISYLSFGSTLSTVLNYVLVVATRVAAPVAGCSVTYVFCPPPGESACRVGDGGDLTLAACRPCGWPDYNAQALAFLFVALAAPTLAWLPAATIGRVHALVLVAVYMLSVASSTFFHFKSPSQIAGGVLVGTAFGVAVHVYGSFVVRPVLARILRWRLFVAMQYDSAFCPPEVAL